MSSGPSRRPRGDRYRDPTSSSHSHRPRRNPSHQFQREVGRGVQQRPLPMGRRCNALCPLFRCSQKALVASTRHVKGKPQRTMFCRWIGDECIGASCQYAFCAVKALLPNGDCLHAVQKQGEKRKDLLDEIKESELDAKMRDLLARRLGRRDLELI